MMQNKLFFNTIAVSAMLILSTVHVEAAVFIHEFLADPASGLAGDANNDGTRNSSADEFVELFNDGDAAEDLSGWSIADSSSVRHMFDTGSMIMPNSALVVFGGGSPVLTNVVWQTSSSGSFALNNGGDTIMLYDSSTAIIDTVTYGSEGGNDQSVVRSPEGTQGEWVQHSELEDAADLLFSPGSLVSPLEIVELPDEEADQVNPVDPVNDPDPTNPVDPYIPVDDAQQNTVPEPATVLSLACGLGAMFIINKKRLVYCT